MIAMTAKLPTLFFYLIIAGIFSYVIPAEVEIYPFLNFLPLEGGGLRWGWKVGVRFIEPGLFNKFLSALKVIDIKIIKENTKLELGGD